MNRPELYTKTVDKLLTAYERGELKHGICKACAVGNICGNGDWENIFGTAPSSMRSSSEAVRSKDIFTQYLTTNTYSYLTEELKRTGYTLQELMDIEFAFETAPGYEKVGIVDQPTLCEFVSSNKTAPEWMYNGLCAVLLELGRIHEISLPDTVSLSKLTQIFNETLA